MGGGSDQSKELSGHENSGPPLIPGLCVPFSFGKHTHRAKEQVGFKRNKLPKYGCERAFSDELSWKLLQNGHSCERDGVGMQKASSIISLTSQDDRASLPSFRSRRCVLWSREEGER